eukprot:356189-Chlamydomonas_euryale.AAC.3
MYFEAGGDLDTAVGIYKDALTRDPTAEMFHKRLVAVEKTRGNAAAAVDALRKYLETFSADREGWEELAELYVEMGMLKQALFCYEELIMMSPTASYLVREAVGVAQWWRQGKAMCAGEGRGGEGLVWDCGGGREKGLKCGGVAGAEGFGRVGECPLVKRTASLEVALWRRGCAEVCLSQRAACMVHARACKNILHGQQYACTRGEREQSARQSMRAVAEDRGVPAGAAQMAQCEERGGGQGGCLQVPMYARMPAHMACAQWLQNTACAWQTDTCMHARCVPLCMQRTTPSTPSTPSGTHMSRPHARMTTRCSKGAPVRQLLARRALPPSPCTDAISSSTVSRSPSPPPPRRHTGAVRRRAVHAGTVPYGAIVLRQGD